MQIKNKEYIKCQDAESFLNSIDNESVHLFAIDPPYFNITDDAWDNQWKNEQEYIDWLMNLISISYNKLTSNGSLLMFGGIGKDNSHPFFKIILEIEKQTNYYFRNMISWKKRRAYGKSHDYLFCREEIVWYSKSEERTNIRFNIPLLKEKRGYDGFNKKYKAKSEYKRVSNIWDDIPELMKPVRNCQKPIPLMERIISTHSNVDDLVCDFFAGTGSTGVAAVKLNRRFIGCDLDKEAIILSNIKINEANILPNSTTGIREREVIISPELQDALTLKRGLPIGKL